MKFAALLSVFLSPAILCAATIVSYTSTADPNLSPDAVDNFGAPVDVWFCSLPGGTGSYLAGDGAWAMYSVSQQASAYHFFDGGAIEVDQGMSISFSNAGMAAGHSVGINLSSGGTPVFSLYFTGGGTSTYSYNDAGGVGLDSGEPFSWYGSNTLTFTLTSPTTYTASFGTHSWTGTLAPDSPIESIEVFNDSEQNLDNSVFFKSLEVFAVPEPSIGELMLAGAACIAFFLRRSRDGR